MDIGDSLWDDRTPLEQLLSMAFCFGLFLLIISSTYLVFFAHTYNLPNSHQVFGMEFDVCTKEVCMEHDAVLRLVKQRSGGAKLKPALESVVLFYQSCSNWTARNLADLEPLRDVLRNLSVHYWPLLDVYGEEYNAPRLLLRLLLRFRLDVFVSLRVQRSLRKRSRFVLNVSDDGGPLCRPL
ncbi:uncharacterized protein LOC144146519 [Haemaphysalis longicornis]